MRQAVLVRALSRPWLAVAAIVLSLTLHLSDGFYHEPTLAWLALALAAAVLGVAGVRWPWRREQDDGDAATSALLTAGLLVSAVALVTRPLARYMADPRPWRHPELLIVVAIAAAVALSAAATSRATARRRAGLVLAAVALWLGAWTIRESPRPHIDVIPVHTDAFAALARGQSPYGITFDDMYGPNEPFYSPEMRDGKRVLFGFPYPPLSLMLAWPGHALLGDLRYSEALALSIAILLLIWIGRDVGVLCAAALLLAPRLVFHLEQGWTEPFPIVLIVATVATALRQPSWGWLPLGLLMASKQHMVLALLFVTMLVPRARADAGALVHATSVGRFALKAVAVAAAVTVPLALMDVDAFIRSAVLLQLREPFRLDSLSFTRMFVAYGWPLDKHGALYVSLVAGATALGLAWWRAPRSPAGFAASLALSCFFLAAFGKKAFLNYYFLVFAALLTAIAAARPRAPATAVTPAGQAPLQPEPRTPQG